MWWRIGDLIAGIITGIAGRWITRRGARRPKKDVRCPNCGGPVPATWKDGDIPGYQWDTDKCPNCYWRY